MIWDQLWFLFNSPPTPPLSHNYVDLREELVVRYPKTSINPNFVITLSVQ